MSGTKVRQPKLQIIVTDESMHLREDLKEKVGKFKGVYLVDVNEETHLCEMQGSHYLRHLYNQVEHTDNFKTEDDDYTEELFELELRDDEQNCYVHTSETFEVVHEHEETDSDYKDGVSEEEYAEYMESKVEYYTSNHVI